MHTEFNQPTSLQRRAQQQESEFLAYLAAHSQYAVTLQTQLKTYNVTSRTMQQYETCARESLHQLRVRFNRALTGNGWRRKPAYTPIFVASLEGTRNTYDRHRSLHFHLMIGNVGAHRNDVESALRSIWPHTAAGSGDIVVRDMSVGSASGWSDYITKERHLGNWECVDYFNAQWPPSLGDGLVAIS